MSEINCMSMYDCIVKSYDNRRDYIAIYYLGKKITADYLLKQIDYWASVLHSKYNISNGDVVAMNLPNIPNAIILFYAINKLGAIADLFHPYLPIQALIDKTKEHNCKLLITLDLFYEKNYDFVDEQFKDMVLVARISDYLPVLKKIIYKRKEPKFNKRINLYNKLICKKEDLKGVERDFNKVAVYMHSAGTSGEAKTIVLSNYAINSLSLSLSSVIANMEEKHNKFIMVLPLFHGFGLGVCMHTTLFYSAEIDLIPKFNAKLLAKTVAKRKATLLAGVPTMFSKLLELDKRLFYKLHFLENIFCGGEKLTSNLKKEFDNKLKDIGSTAELLEGYGLTETVTVCTINKRLETDANAVGFPLSGVHIKIIDADKQLLPNGEIGEICLSGPTLMESYLDNDNCQEIIINDERYILTGDIGYLDEYGKLHLIDRKKRIFKINGVTIFPSEIEQVIVESCSVDKCLAIYINEKIIVFVQAQGDTDLIKSQAIDACTKNLLPYAIPFKENIYVLNCFPKSPVGKIDIEELKRKIG